MLEPKRGASKPEPLLHFSSSECDRQAALVRAYCESRFPVGEPTYRRRSVTGEPYTELCALWPDGLGTIDQARKSAESAFQKYAEGKSGTLYWRIPPEIAWGAKRQRFAYYMRLLISDKPRKS